MPAARAPSLSLAPCSRRVTVARRTLRGPQPAPAQGADGGEAAGEQPRGPDHSEGRAWRLTGGSWPAWDPEWSLQQRRLR